MRTQLLLPTVALLLATSCSTGPKPPQPGTPAFIWNAANAAWKSGDFIKTSENLQQLVKADGEFTARARPWAIVVSSGLAHGYMATADGYEAGAKANRQNPMPFRREVSQMRSLATSAAVEFAETVHLYMQGPKDANVPLAFEFPTGSAAEPPNMRKVMAGALIQDSERESLLRTMLQRGVVLSASRAAGAPDDTPKAMEAFKTPEPQRPRPQFLFGVAQELYDRSDLFVAAKLDHPGRMRVLCEQALETLKEVPESKETKALTAKLQASLKKIKGNT